MATHRVGVALHRASLTQTTSAHAESVDVAAMGTNRISTQQTLRTRRAKIVRRWAARTRRAKRAAFDGGDDTEEVVGIREDLAELPDDLL